MTGFQPAPGIWQVEMRYTAQDVPCENVYHVKSTGAMDYAEAGALYDVLTTWETDSARDARANDVSLNSIRIVDLTTAGSTEYVNDAGLPIDGTASGAPEPQNVTVAVKADTGLAGRSNRGRSYWIGLTKLFTTGGLIGASAGTAITSRMNELLTAVNGGGPWVMVVLSRRTAGHARAHGIGIPIVTWTLTDHYLDSQRRRLPGHNRHH